MSQTATSGSTVADELISRFRNREATVGIVGLGYVGLPLAFSAVRHGFSVVGFDIDGSKVDKLRNGISYLSHVDAAPLAEGLSENRFDATTQFQRIRDVDAVLICVPTPLGLHREPDTSYIESTVSSIVPFLKRGQLVSLESSTYPSTTRTLVAQPIEESGLVVGEDVFVVYSPEREDPGNASFAVSQIPKLLGGVSPRCNVVGEALYSNLVSRVVPTRTLEVAEMAKLLENIYRAVNIGLVNEMKMVADKLGVSIWEVIDAASTKPFGFTPFYPGPGLGGHCIPIDPFYLTWKAREVGVNTRFIELAGEINSSMPAWVVSKISAGLNRAGIAVGRARVLILGVAYKKNIDDMRESPAIEIIEQLSALGASVEYSDPHVPSLPPMRRHTLEMESVPLTPSRLEEYDCVVVATDHDEFDYDLVLDCARLIVDTRGRYRQECDHVVGA